jgi:hypothetical protein
VAPRETAVVSESPVCRSGPNPYPEREHKVNPHVADDAERAQVWEQIATAAHSFVRFQVRTGRGFPIWPPGSPTNPQEHRTGEHKQLSHYAERIGVQPAISHNPMSVEIMAEGRVPYQEPDAFGGTPQERSEAISTYLSYTGPF